MKVGIPTEVKNHEYRVAITPAGVFELMRHGHEVFVQWSRSVSLACAPKSHHLCLGAKAQMEP